MSVIVMIGGGKKQDTRPIDWAILKASGKKHPRVLFIPTASLDSEPYIESFTAHYESLGATVSVLRLWKVVPPDAIVKKIILSADVIYVGGGNTLRMLKRWKALGVTKHIFAARKKGIVLCGLSAGAICWCRFGNSDSWKYSNPKAPYIRIRALGMVPVLLCPHADTEKGRRSSVKTMMKRTPGIGMAVDECAALWVEDDQWRVLTTKAKAKVVAIACKNGRCSETTLPSDGKLRPWFLLMP